MTGAVAMVTEVVRGIEQRCYATRPRGPVQLLQQAVARSGPDPLLVDPALGTSSTYAEFAALVEGAAQALVERGLRPGDRVALLARNGLEAAVCIWACARAGLLHVGIPPDAPPDRIRALLALTDPALLLAQPALRAAAATAATSVEDAADVLLGSPTPWQPGRTPPGEDATYCLLATSGTTGYPKAVRVTGRMLGHAAAFYVGALALDRADRTAIHLPFAWVSGHVTQLAPTMLAGGSAVTMPAFSAQTLLETAARHGVTWLDVVPSIFELLLRAPSLAELSRVRVAVFGGSPAAAGTLDRIRERLPQLDLVDVYALSETCAPVTSLSDAESRHRPGSVGRPAPYCRLRLVDPEGRAVSGGGTGEVQVCSPTTTPGYWGEQASPVGDDGWLRTGDLGRLDADGYLWIGGRAVELIIRGGVNIYPAEVERALLGTGLLSDAAVVAVPARVAGQSPAAVVVGRSAAPVDVGLLQRAVRQALGAHAVPRPLQVVGQVPRSANGKVDRRAVTALLTQAGPTAQHE